MIDDTAVFFVVNNPYAALHVLASCLYKGIIEQEHNIANSKTVIHNVVPSREHTHASRNISRYRFQMDYHSSSLV